MPSPLCIGPGLANLTCYGRLLVGLGRKANSFQTVVDTDHVEEGVEGICPWQRIIHLHPRPSTFDLCSSNQAIWSGSTVGGGSSFPEKHTIGSRHNNVFGAPRRHQTARQEGGGRRLVAAVEVWPKRCLAQAACEGVNDNHFVKPHDGGRPSLFGLPQFGTPNSYFFHFF
ncbi:hypothetical protein SUGI_1018430 [Cryptomeria japonica]|nr:hypothetical protein SUGI_1018430 [Cryptomeria japonica]